MGYSFIKVKYPIYNSIPWELGILGLDFSFL
jgi:hypothetical protein